MKRHEVVGGGREITSSMSMTKGFNSVIKFGTQNK